jgi:SAM-dependent methyltransferase
MASEREKAFWRIHEKLPRQAPGSDASTQTLLELANLPKLPAKALDIGCGPGRSSLLLAQHGCTVTAIDTSDVLLGELEAAAEESGYNKDIDIQNVSMFEMPYRKGSFDIVWAEGAAYIVGWEVAVQYWQNLLRPDGTMVLTECCWLTDTPSREARKFWNEGYPTMLTVKQAIEKANAFGLTVENIYILPESDWWNEYYTPITKRLISNEHSTDKALRDVIAATKEEIELRKNHAQEYGYVGFVLSKG